MSVNLSQKERSLLTDLKGHEEVCIEKYSNYANQANDPELKNMFNTHESDEKDHLNTINQILSGTVPSMGAGGGVGGGAGAAGTSGTSRTAGTAMPKTSNMQSQGKSTGMNNADASSLCKDLLMTEKYVSNSYDTSIFEFKDTGVRDALNHIQKEEQKHGEDLYNYMAKNNMYNMQ
ncbi:MAG TPA: spore coat protein [Clostridiaceae bacterium]|jgi:spore coat protein CotF|nr:spore coat protein [Clostridiaceae bacterium]HBF77013.1 spore coat protein [Clostridiaceae bacterium]HBG38539.1 spore coat protein [Clostridiaceae bacterium]HBN29207.1 spore coat protein [Clostridiaceae bacterium]HBX47285.1 spore coat protein [Clostridiaceae bacterium]